MGGGGRSPGKSCVVGAAPQSQPWHGTTALHPAVCVDELRVTRSQKPKENPQQATKMGPVQAIRSGSRAKIRCRGGGRAADVEVTFQE